MKKALAIVASPRRNENTQKIVSSVVDGLLEKDILVKKINLKDLNISACTACGYCEHQGECIIKDDMTEIYKDFDEADIVVFGSPVYFNTVSSYAKAMIDRCQMFWSSKYKLRKPSIDVKKKRLGVFIAVGGAPYYKEQFDSCISVTKLFFKAINTSYSHEILVSDTDKKQIESREDILKRAYFIGKELV
ncbi:flavodoxin family protein [Clostridiaceae bacterium M8S5]|nr:flavodoxin family protein [Clostridiaceae bacterium M8S5]